MLEKNSKEFSKKQIITSRNISLGMIDSIEVPHHLLIIPSVTTVYLLLPSSHALLLLLRRPHMLVWSQILFLILTTHMQLWTVLKEVTTFMHIIINLLLWWFPNCSRRRLWKYARNGPYGRLQWWWGHVSMRIPPPQLEYYSEDEFSIDSDSDAEEVKLPQRATWARHFSNHLPVLKRQN